MFGATVDLEDGRAGERVTYQIVGEDEADIKHGKISVRLADCARIDRRSRKATRPTCRRLAASRSYEIIAVRYV